MPAAEAGLRRGTLVYAACGQFAAVERSPAHHVQRSNEGAQVYAVQHLAYYNAVADQSLITVDREILGGTPVFNGTRVPVKTLFEYLEDNYSLDEFIRVLPDCSVARWRTGY